MDFPRWAGRGVSLRPRGRRVSGSLLRGFSWRVFGCLLWLCVLRCMTWWWIGGASMGIPSSLLSISGLEAWCYETHRFVSRCLARIRGAPFEGSVRPTFGGAACVGAGRRLGELVLRLGWTPRVLWRISRRLLEFFLRNWLRGVKAAVLAASGDEEVPPP